jgi:hypothetical protein
MRALPVLGVVLLLAGCSLTGDDGGGGAQVTEDELENTVLQPADVGPSFIVFDEGPQRNADQPAGRSALDRFGRTGGWKARYRRPGTMRTTGPLVIVSLVDSFDSDDGAAEELAAVGADLDDGEPPWQEVSAPELGDEALARTLQQSGVSFFRVAWREGNVVASVEVNGFTGKVSAEDAAALARKQAQRVSEAAA